MIDTLIGIHVMHQRFTRSLLFIFILLICMGLLSGQAAADDKPVWQIATDIRQALFAAQGALLKQDAASAEAQVRTAQTLYQQSILPLLTADFPAGVTHLDRDFADALQSSQTSQSPALAAWRSQIWTGLLQASTVMTLNALEQGNGSAAQNWLALREFRPSTAISQPRADATQEIYALIGGRREAADVYVVVRSELYDTYQALLNQSLRDADEADRKQFWVRRAEEIGLAAGYFDILADAYAQERGTPALETLQTTFDSLLEETANTASGQYVTLRQSIDDSLSGFVAAPLTEVEMSRRAGQMLRFLALIPVEYDRAVRLGTVVNAVEYQDALRYYDNARVSFADVKAVIEQSDAAQAQDIENNFRGLEAQLQQLEDPSVVQNVTFEIASGMNDLIPSRWRYIDSSTDIQAIRVILAQVESDVLAGAYDQALTTCIGAYTILQQSIDQKLAAFAPDVELRIDTLLWQGEPDQPSLAALLATGAATSDIQTALLKVNSALDDAETALNAKAAPASVVANTAVIVLREGLEAVLILAALLANLRAEANRTSRRALLAGALTAGLLAIITWWLTSAVLRSFTGPGPILSAVVSLLSVAVMLLVTNWFFHRVYWTDHMAGLHARKNRLLRLGQRTSFFTLGFISVYREGFETTLFLQPLSMSGETTRVLIGLLLGLAGVVGLGVVVFLLNARMPYRRMLTVTGALMLVVLFTLVGNTVYTLQVAGWMPIAPIQGLLLSRRFSEWFGLFPTWQGILLQTFAGLFVVGSYIWAKRCSTTARKVVKTPQARAADKPLDAALIEAHKP